MQGKLVGGVEPGSIAEELGIRKGDRVLGINGEEPRDILDWLMAESGKEMLLTVLHDSGELVEYDIEKDYDEPLGIVFDSPTLEKIRPCQNRCVFCFVDQLPAAMRETLYLKDDDYRLSFTTGSYVTLTNLSEEDLERIIRLHLSPLYISVHATEPALRRQMLNHPRAGEILAQLRRLTGAGIMLHTQIVVCPGLNDGSRLEETIADLYRLGGGVASLALVPVGLTGHRDGLYALSACDTENAGAILAVVRKWQEKSLRERGSRFIYASDEFYTMAGAEIPPDEEYDTYPQLENGVGLIRLLYNDWEAWLPKLPQAVQKKTQATLATGVSAARYLEPIVRKLNSIEMLTVELVAVENRFFGGYVTVAGLLTWRDLFFSLQKTAGSGPVYLPRVMLRQGTNMFLDGNTVDELSLKLAREVKVTDDLPSLLESLFES